MKKIGFSLFFATCLLVYGQAQNVDVPETQVPVIMKVTASWCPFCGGWGWNFMENLYDDNEEDAILMPIHYSGDHTNPIAIDIAVNIGAIGQPRFFFNGVDQNVSSGTAAAKRIEIANMVQEAITMSPSIQAGIEATYYMDDLNIDYSVKAFEDLDGEYYAAFYLAEKSFFGFQSGIGNNAEHLNLMREEASGNSFGTMIFSGNTSGGAIYDGSVSLSLEDFDPDNLEVIGIIWKKEGNVYKVVNSNIDDSIDEQLTSSTTTIEAQEGSVSVFPSVVSDQFTVISEGIKIKEDPRLSVIDLNGRILMQNIFMPGTENQVKLNRADIHPGVYFVVVNTSEKSFTTRIIVK